MAFQFLEQSALADLTDNSGGAAADGTIAAVTAPTAYALKEVHFVSYANIAAATTSGKATQKDLSAGPGAMASLVQPDVPRNVVITITDANTSISAFQIDVVGTSPDGSAVTEQFLFSGGLVQAGSKVFATVTSVTVTSITGHGAGDTLDLGYGVKIGLPVPFGATTLAIIELLCDGTAEAATATDTTNNSFTSTTAPNGSHDYDIRFRYTHPLSVTQAANRAAIVALTDAVKELSTKLNASLEMNRRAGILLR